MSDRLKDTLKYCLVLFLFIVPVYYLVYLYWWDGVTRAEALQTGLIYGGINVLFLGSLHYFRRRGGSE